MGRVHANHRRDDVPEQRASRCLTGNETRSAPPNARGWIQDFHDRVLHVATADLLVRIERLQTRRHIRIHPYEVEHSSKHVARVCDKVVEEHDVDTLPPKRREVAPDLSVKTHDIPIKEPPGRRTVVRRNFQTSSPGFFSRERGLEIVSVLYVVIEVLAVQ